jgi:AcrR family transcriptional regulator
VRERQLLEVAERVFAREGYQGASLEQVAKEAGVTRQYLNKLFGDKEGLYLACHARARNQLDAMLAQAGSRLPAEPSRADARDALCACVEAYFTFVRDQGAGWDVLFGAGSAVAGPATAEVTRLRFETVRLLAQLLLRAGPGLDPTGAEVFAHAMSGSGNQIAVWWRQTDVPLDEVVDRFVAVFWDGVAPFAPAP